MSLVWPWLLAPPVFIALFAVHQTLKQRRSAYSPPPKRVAQALEGADVDVAIIDRSNPHLFRFYQ